MERGGTAPERLQERRMIFLDCIREILKNIAMASPAVRRQRARSGRSGPAMPVDGRLDRFAFASLKEVLKVVETVRGCRVLEFGPGDHLASGLCFLAAGAKSYTAVEPFPGDYRSDRSRAWYSAVRAAWHERFPGLEWPAGLSADSFPDTPGVTIVPSPLESARNLGSYEIVCSHFAGQHVKDIDLLARATFEHLHAEGVAVHKVGMGPQDCWRHYRDPLVFLRFSDPVWRLMGSNRAIPNRRRHHEFMNAFREAGLRIEAREIVRFEHAMDAALLDKQFRSAPRSSLEVRVATYVGRRDR